MYNDKIKRIYLNSNGFNEDAKQKTEKMFESFRAVEEKFNCDIYDMSQEQLAYLLSVIGVSSTSSINSIISKLKGYIDWAINVGLTQSCENPLNSKHYKIIGLSEIIDTTMVGSPEELSAIINKVEADKSISNEELLMSKAILWLYYYGFSIDDVRSLESEHIKQSAVIKPTSGALIAVPAEVTQLLLDCSRLVSIPQRTNRGGVIYRDLIKNKYVFRGAKKDGADECAKVTSRFIARKVKQFSDAYTKIDGRALKFSMYSLNASYKYLCLYNIEQKNGELCNSDYVSVFNIDENSYHPVVKAKKMNILKDNYQAWKRNFKKSVDI